MVSFFGLRARVAKMSLLRYLKPANGLPDPRGSFSTVISPDVISEIIAALLWVKLFAADGRQLFRLL